MNSLTTGKVLAYLVIIFVAGGATGAVITVNRGRQQQAQAPSMEKACHRLQDRLTSRLNLTHDQIATLQPVFDRTARDLQDVHTRALQDIDALIRQAHQEVAKVLTPEQKVRLELCDKERYDWLRRRLPEPIALDAPGSP